MRKKSGVAVAAAAFAAVLLSAPVQGGEQAEYMPLPRVSGLSEVFIIARTKNIMQTVDAASGLVDLVMPGMGMQMKAMVLQQIFMDPTGMVLDPNAPSAFILGNMRYYGMKEPPPMCFIVSASQSNALFNTFAQLARKDPNTAMGGTLADPDDDFYLRIVGTKVVLSSSQRLLEDVTSALNANPDFLTSVDLVADIDVLVDAQKMVETYGMDLRNVMEELAQKASAEMEPGDPDMQRNPLMPLFGSFLPLAAPLLKMVPDLAGQFDGLRLTLKIKPDRMSGGITCVTRLYPVEGSTLGTVLEDFFQPIDPATARDHAAKLPEGAVFLVAGADMTEAGKVMEKIASRISDTAAERAVPADALLTFLLEKVPSMLPEEDYTSSMSVKVGDTDVDMAGVVTPPTFPKGKMREIMQATNEAMAASQLYQGLSMMMGNTGQPMPRGYLLEDLPELNGFKAVIDYSEGADPRMLEALKSVYGDPPAQYYMYSDDRMMWYQGSRGLEGAREYARGVPDNSLASTEIFDSMLTSMPEDTSWLIGVRPVGIFRMQLRMAANNPFLGQLAALDPMLKNFTMDDQPIQIYVFRDRSTTACKTFVPARTITNLASAAQAVMMTMRAGRAAGGQGPGGQGAPGGPGGFDEDVEEDLPF